MGHVFPSRHEGRVYASVDIDSAFKFVFATKYPARGDIATPLWYLADLVVQRCVGFRFTLFLLIALLSLIATLYEDTHITQCCGNSH